MEYLSNRANGKLAVMCSSTWGCLTASKLPKRRLKLALQVAQVLLLVTVLLQMSPMMLSKMVEEALVAVVNVY